MIFLMFRVFAILLFCGAFLTALSRAHAADAPKQARPPTEYDGRVKMYEMPAKMTPPRLPDVRPDPRTISGRDSDFVPGLAPKNNLSIIPSPGDSGGDPSGERGSPGRMRDILRDGWRDTEPKQSQPSSWGWLADEIATNRARRSVQQSASMDDDDDERNGADRGAGSNRTSTAQNKNMQQGERTDVAAQSARMEPVLSTFSDSSSAAADKQDDLLAAPTIDVRGAADDRIGSRAAVDVDSYAGWSSAASAIPAPSLFGSAADSAAARVAQRPVRESSEPARSVATDARFTDPGRFTPSESPSMFSGSSFTDAGSSFKPFEIKPLDTAPIGIPSSAAPLPTYTAPGYSAAATPSVGGMGSQHERERATPKTLPW